MVKWPSLYVRKDCREERGLYAQSTPRLSVSLLHRCIITVTAQKNSSDNCMYPVYGRLRAFCNFGFRSFPSQLLDRTQNCHCTLSEWQQGTYRDLFRNGHCHLDSPSASFQARSEACQAFMTGQSKVGPPSLSPYQNCYDHIKHWTW